MRTGKEIAEAVSKAVHKVNVFYTTTQSKNGKYGALYTSGTKELSFTERFINGEPVMSADVARIIVDAANENGITVKHLQTVGAWRY